MKKITALLLAVALCLTGGIVAYASDNSSNNAGKIPVDIGTTPEAKTTITEATVVPTTGAYDIEDTTEKNGTEIAPYNVDKSVNFLLEKGQSKTFTFNVNGGLLGSDHNTVSVVIDTLGTGDEFAYQYISEDVTNNTELANLRLTSSTTRTLYNLDPDSTYEVTIINLTSNTQYFTVSITSYIS